VEILDSDRVYRRLAPGHLRKDGSVNSSAFMVNSQFPPMLWVDLARLTSPEESLRRAPPGRGFGLGELVVGELRGLGLDVLHSPAPPEDPTNDAHCHIAGTNSREMARRLAEITRVVAHPSVPGA
jgi:hypothetical protein